MHFLNRCVSFLHALLQRYIAMATAGMATVGLAALCTGLLVAQSAVAAPCHDMTLSEPAHVVQSMEKKATAGNVRDLSIYVECMDHCAPQPALSGGDQAQQPSAALSQTAYLQPADQPVAQRLSFSNLPLIVDPPVEIRFCRYRE